MKRVVTCSTCGGTGYVNDSGEYGEFLDECPTCHGECCVTEERVVYRGELLRVVTLRLQE